MPQDQGPIQEPQISRADLAVGARSFHDLIERTDGLDPDLKIAIDGAGYDLEMLIKKWKGKRDSWSELKGKRVLDLASGSAKGRRKWQPFFARLCANNGADVTAVDVLPQAGSDIQLFRGVQADLVNIVDEGKLAQAVGRQSFDIVHSYQFVGLNIAPDLLERLRQLGINEVAFTRDLLEQSSRLLVEGGIMFLDESDEKGSIYYTKKEGKLVRL